MEGIFRIDDGTVKTGGELFPIMPSSGNADSGGSRGRGRGPSGVLIVRINDFHHHLLAGFLRRGDSAVDCTVGQGRDALFLARAVGEGGHLFGLDIQPEAIAATRSRLLRSGVDEGRFTLLGESHERIAEHVPPGIGGAVYNLGYLPGGDRSVVTEPGTTLRSMDGALGLLRPEGVLGVTMYHRHEGGRREADAVLKFAASLPHSSFAVLHFHYPNLPGDPPSMLLIQRL